MIEQVLITGGSGSFGNAMVKFLCSLESIKRICVYSRDEFKQSKMRMFIDDSRVRYFIGDVRDFERLKRAMEGIDLVIHAAALKRIEVGVYDPMEVVKTNVVGSMNVINAAMDAKVKKVVALSTDKAFEPVNLYGSTKLAMEKMVLAANNARGQGGPRFAVTRYGNIAGSTGSVIPIWKQAIAEGRDVTVSDPNCTRFWMTQQEAVELVWEVAEVMEGGELAVPHLPAYLLWDLLQAMDVKEWVTKGIGADEKRHESMGPDMCSEHAPRMTISQLREGIAKL